ncbi:MAG: hypothetical protein KBE25_00485 [Laribacter sp.]|nr:hypothetical protein [Laribacter sp.]MBP9607822.1 hypothetical protein [Laribacter sp.]
MNKLIIIIAVEDPVSRSYVERLQRMNSEMRAQVIDLEERYADASEAAQRNWTLYESSLYEVRQLKENLMELGCQNIALAAEAESARFDAEQLDAANARIRELEAALTVSKLPANSRAAVIQLVQEAA